MNKMDLNSKDFIHVPSGVCSSQSRSCMKAVHTSPQAVRVKGSHLSLSVSLKKSRRCQADVSVAQGHGCAAPHLGALVPPSPQHPAAGLPWGLGEGTHGGRYSCQGSKREMVPADDFYSYPFFGLTLQGHPQVSPPSL